MIRNGEGRKQYGNNWWDDFIGPFGQEDAANVFQQAYSKTIAYDLVPVQPMKEPHGLILPWFEPSFKS